MKAALLEKVQKLSGLYEAASAALTLTTTLDAVHMGDQPKTVTLQLTGKGTLPDSWEQDAEGILKDTAQKHHLSGTSYRSGPWGSALTFKLVYSKGPDDDYGMPTQKVDVNWRDPVKTAGDALSAYAKAHKATARTTIE